MGEIYPYTREKLIMGILTTRPNSLSQLEEVLRDEFGPIDFQSDPIPFDFTEYYNVEMGEGILRVFLSFEELVSPDRLSEIKVRCNALEQRFIEGRKRKVNLDPGLLSLGKLILASTKDNAQRIPLSRGIYGEITLIYQKKKYRPLPWTYPDYQSEAYHEILYRIRSIYAGQLSRVFPQSEDSRRGLK